ncbi:MAG: hypothetical protein QW764_04890 [Desulfurococcaceae archaeon]
MPRPRPRVSIEASMLPRDTEANRGLWSSMEDPCPVETQASGNPVESFSTGVSHMHGLSLKILPLA